MSALKLAFLAALFLSASTASVSAEDPNDLMQQVTELRSAVNALREDTTNLRGTASLLSRLLVPVGTVVAFAGNVEQIPENWRWCDGSEVSRLDYPALFAAIKTLWGGDGEPMFRVPDLQGRFLRGSDLLSSNDRTKWRDPDRDARKDQAGNTVGNLTGSVQDDATSLPKKPFHTQGGGHTHAVGAHFVQLKFGEGGVSSPLVPPAGHQLSGGEHDHTFGGGDAESRPKNVYVTWIIRVR